jgi:DNA-binding NarL/FixJ family response regulator
VPDGNCARPSRILIAAEVRLYRDGLAHVFDSDRRFLIVGGAATEAEALALTAKARPDLVLLDWTMACAPRLAEQLLAVHPTVRILALGITEVKQDVLRLAEAGVAGYVTRDATLDDLRASAASSAHRTSWPC